MSDTKVMDEIHTSRDIHNTDSVSFEGADVTVHPNGTPWYESKAYKSLLALVALVRWVIVAIVFAFGVYLYQRDVNAQSAVNVNDISREIKTVRELAEERKRQSDTQYSELKMNTVDKSLFNAQFDALNKRLDRIETALDRVGPR